MSYQYVPPQEYPPPGCGTPYPPSEGYEGYSNDEPPPPPPEYEQQQPDQEDSGSLISKRVVCELSSLFNSSSRFCCCCVLEEVEAIVTKGWKNSSHKRGKMNEGDDDEEEGIASVELVLLREPLDVFGSDIMLLIIDNLDARDVALCLLVSRGWNEVALSDSLWNTRTRIMKEDLCDHVWDFRFKKEVPEYWLNLDPSWNGTSPPMHRYFHPDGSQSADPDDQVWGGHECTFKTITSFVGEGKIGERYVRINKWPHMTVARKHDWSWELTNRLYWYSSTPDADKEGGTGRLPQCGM